MKESYKKGNEGEQESHENIHRGGSLPHTQERSAETKSPKSWDAVKLALERTLGST